MLTRLSWMVPVRASHPVTVRWRLGPESSEGWMGLALPDGFFTHLSSASVRMTGTAGD